GWHVGTPQELEDSLAQDVAIDHGHALDLPVLRVLRDQLVDLALVELGATHQSLGELAYLGVHGVPRPELVEVRDRRALVLHVQLVQELEGELAGLATLAHQGRRRGVRRACDWSSRFHTAISSAARAASSPRARPAPPPRSHACASAGAVMPPKLTAPRVLSAPGEGPRAASPTTKSKCGVSPRITTPTPTMPA